MPAFFMKKLLTIIGLILPFFLIMAAPAFAVSSDVTQFTNNTLGMITLISTAAAVFFLVKGGYQYITSTGKPDNLESAKKTIRNAIIGLVIVLGASLFVSVLSNYFRNN
jgi:TRAP-type C4-dicarboxylate transport system permease small subunit